MLPLTLADYATLAESRLAADVLAYFAGGAGDEISLAENEAAFARLRLVPRVLCGPPRSTAVTLFGQQLSAPLVVAPMAYQKLAHPEGECGMAMAASAQELAMAVSMQASERLETVRLAGPAASWFQLAFLPDAGLMLSLVRRAEEAGYVAIVLTLDAPVNGVRDREIRAGFQLPPEIGAENLGSQASMAPCFASWRDVEWLAARTRLPVVAKGILSEEDVTPALQSGLSGIVVSNHGGRVLDGAIAPIEALENVALAVDRRVPVLVDGGIRRGTDIVKALALGADAVMVGRPVLYGLAVDGARGASHVLRLLKDEFSIAMALCGTPGLEDIRRALLR